MKGVSKANVDKLRPGQVLWDDRLRGFCCRCRKTTKTYSVWRWIEGKKQRFTIGRHGDLTPVQARKEAERMVAEIALGKDPTIKRSRSKAEMTVSQLCDEFTRKHLPNLKPDSRKAYERWIRLYIKPHLGKLSVNDVTRADILNLHNRMRDIPVAANHVRRVLSKMFNFASDMGLRTGDNPCRRVKHYAEKGRQRYLSQEELDRLFKVLERTEARHPHVVACIRLLIWTGARKNEIVRCKWDQVDLKRGVLVLPDSKTGPKEILLNDAAQNLLRKMPRVQGNPHVIACGDAGGYQQGMQYHWDRIRAQAGLRDVRLHDLRHSFASAAVSSGYSLPVIGALLGHKDVKSTARYSHLYDSTLRDAANAIGNCLNGFKSGQ